MSHTLTHTRIYFSQRNPLWIIVSSFGNICSTFVSAVPEGTRSADGSRSFFQRVGAAAQRVTFAVEVERVLSGDAVGAAHAAADRW